MMKSSLWSLALVLLCAWLANADEGSHHYLPGEAITLWVNKIGPYRNPQETYLYYTLPWCHPGDIIYQQTKSEGLGEALQGYELRMSGMVFYFNQPMENEEFCTKTLSEDEAEIFKDAILNQYWYQLFLDDLPIWGMVGEIVSDDGAREPKTYIFTHKKFSIAFNENQIIEVNLTSENPTPVEAGQDLKFTYSVSWEASDIEYSDRFDKYLDNDFFEHQIHWFSIFNSFMMVIFLTGLVSMILMRTLRKDYAKYAKEDEDIEDVGDESGWKLVHGDVFRAPTHLMLFSGLVGTGHQISILVLCVVSFSIIGAYYRTRGSVVTAFILCYALTSFIGGYSSGGYYSRNGGRSWIKCMLLAGGIFPGFCFLVSFLLNFIAVGYGSLAAIPPGTMLAVTVIWVTISYPLTLLGTIIGKNWNGQPDNPCRISPVPRHIPDKKWYQQPLVYVCLGGILPFGSIFIEMYFIFTSFWHHKYYYVYGFMLLVYIILVIVSVCVTIVSTYFLLNSEDYRWQWTSLLSSSSTATYVYLYSIYYFFAKTKMSGFFQTAFYFGYMAMFCFGLGLLCGAIGFIGTSIFVRRIYQNVKID